MSQCTIFNLYHNLTKAYSKSELFCFWVSFFLNLGHVLSLSYVRQCLCVRTCTCMQKWDTQTSFSKRKKNGGGIVASLMAITHPKAKEQGKHRDAFIVFHGFGLWPHTPPPPIFSVALQWRATTTSGGGGESGVKLHVPTTTPMSPWLRPHIICRVHSPNDDSQHTVMWFPGLFILCKATKSSIGWEAHQKAPVLL